MPDTWNVPLYPEFPIPVRLTSLLTFLTMIWSQAFNPCGCSEITVTTFDASVHVLINLGDLSKS